MTLASERARIGREPFVVVELDLDRCTRDFGVAPCTGTGEKCYKSLANCKSTGAYEKSVGTLVGCSVRNPVPAALGPALPLVEGVEITPATLDPKGGLGSRGVVTVTFNDIPHNDVGTDPYVDTRTYDPMAQGTLFGKLKARHPYYNKRAMRVKIGYLTVDGVYDPANFRTYTYFIDSFDGPDRQGRFRVTGKDLLKQLDDDRAVCPPPSTGRLASPILFSDTALPLVPTGIGDTEYPPSGLVRIDDELCSFTRLNDILTVVRARDNTKATDHAKDAVVQLCKVITSQTVQNIVNDLYVNYGRLLPGYIPKADWDQEQTDWFPRLYSATITEPTGVKTLTNELLEQTGALTWWDEEGAMVRFKAIRPLGTDTVASLGEQEHILAGSLQLKDDPGSRLSTAMVYYALFDATQSLTEASNYQLLHVEADLEAASDRQYDDTRIKKIQSRWMTIFNSAAAIDLTQKLLYRFRKIPRRASWQLDEKDGDLKPGDFVQLASRQIQKPDGSPEPINIQILSRKFKTVGSVVQYEGVEFFYITPQVGPSGAVERLVPLDAALYSNLNLRTVHDSIYDAPQAGDVIRFVIASGTGVYADPSTSFFGTPPAIYTGTWPDGITVYLDLEPGCWVSGAAGNGATWGQNFLGGYDAQPGTSGGVALLVDPTLNATKLRLNVKAYDVLFGGAGGGAGMAVTAPDMIPREQDGRWGGGGGNTRISGRGIGGVSFFPGDSVQPRLSAGSDADLAGNRLSQWASYVGVGSTWGQNMAASQAIPGTHHLYLLAGTIEYEGDFKAGNGGGTTDSYNFGVPGFSNGPAVQYLRNFGGGAGGWLQAGKTSGQFPVISVSRHEGIFDPVVTVQTLSVTVSGTYQILVGDGGIYAPMYCVVAPPGASGPAISGVGYCTVTGAGAGAVLAGTYGPVVT